MDDEFGSVPVHKAYGKTLEQVQLTVNQTRQKNSGVRHDRATEKLVSMRRFLRHSRV